MVSRISNCSCARAHDCVYATPRRDMKRRRGLALLLLSCLLAAFRFARADNNEGYNSLIKPLPRSVFWCGPGNVTIPACLRLPCCRDGLVAK
jgi:hypothetical protein